ncbi:MAG: hypothetical protein ACK52I_21045 [Pseudomonadota bacterium]
MKPSILRSAPPFALALAVACALGTGAAAVPTSAEARDRPARAADRAMPRGDFQRHTERQRTTNGHVRKDTWTGTDGRNASREAVVVKDRDAGTRTREATTTLPDGRTRSVSDVVTRTENGYTRDTTIVKPNGATLSRDVVATRDAETGKFTKDVTVDRTPAPAPAPAPAT